MVGAFSSSRGDVLLIVAAVVATVAVGVVFGSGGVRSNTKGGGCHSSQ